MARFKRVDDMSEDEYGRSNSERYRRQLSRRRRRGRALRVVLVALIAVVVGGGVAIAAWLGSVGAKINDSSVVTEELRESLAEKREPSDPYYVLLLGTDGRPGEDSYRADTIMLVRVDPRSKQLTLLSIPRDTRVTYKGSTMKINAAHFYDGAAGMVQAVSDLCGVEISHYAEINFDGLSLITDAVGGVTVDVDVHMYDDENFDDVIELQPGVQTLDGAEALFYTRCRHFADGDYTRMRHQRTFIKALVDKVLSSTDLITLTGVVNACADMIITDLPVTDAIGLAYEMVGIDTTSGIYSAYVPFGSFEDVGGESYVVADTRTLAEMMRVIDSGGDPSSLNEGTYGYVDDSTSGGTTSDASSSGGTDAGGTAGDTADDPVE